MPGWSAQRQTAQHADARLLPALLEKIRGKIAEDVRYASLAGVVRAEMKRRSAELDRLLAEAKAEQS